MKRFLFSVFAILFLCGVSVATFGYGDHDTDLKVSETSSYDVGDLTIHLDLYTITPALAIDNPENRYPVSQSDIVEGFKTEVIAKANSPPICQGYA